MDGNIHASTDMSIYIYIFIYTYTSKGTSCEWEYCLACLDLIYFSLLFFADLSNCKLPILRNEPRIRLLAELCTLL